MASSVLSDVDFGDYNRAFDGDFATMRKVDYYLQEDDNADFDLYAFDEVQQIDEGFLAFCWDIVLQVWPNIWISLAACLAWRTFKGIFGLILNRMAAPNCLVFCCKCTGSAMILAMKAVSVSATRIRVSTFTESSFNLGFLRHYLSWCGYAFSPGTVIFGPWFSFDNYMRAIQFIGPTSFNLMSYRDLLQAAVSCAIAIGCIIYSAYLSSIINAIEFLSFRWTNAYAQSQSFRFSHYFVSFFSQSMYQAIGFAAITHSKSRQFCVTALVTNPISVELPRSLVDVVVHWNFPMHFWLKQYIYKPTRRFGQLPALLLTYAFSSILHGLNFQLAAVLFSIGIYAYIDFVLREKLSRRLDACIGARACSKNCRHKNKSSCPWVRVLNLFFSGLAIFHLAYLAVMFDTSEQQDKGYDMFHVLEKWSNLYFLSHIVAAASYLFSLLV
ncbi:hypothetical protein Aperf_G00000127216 [Anoplocephala perfoliata]